MPSIHNFFYQIKAFICHHYKIFIIIFLLMANYFLFNLIYVNVFLHVGKPTYIGNVQGTNQPVLFFFDKFQEIRVAGQETYQLIGWAFPKIINRPLADYNKQIVLINDHSVGYYFVTEGMSRKDVTNYYKDLGINLDQSGYLANISKYVLPKGKFNIALLFSLSDGSDPILFRTDYSLNRTANDLEIIQEK